MRGDRRAKREGRTEERQTSCKILPRCSEQKAGWCRKGSAPKREEGRDQREDRREKRAEVSSRKRSEGCGMVKKGFGP